MSALRRLTRPAASALFFLCFFLSLSASGGLQNLPDLRTLSLGAEVTGKAALAMRERERNEERPVSFAVWGQRNGQTAENPDLGRSASLDVVTLCGNSGLLFPASAPLGPKDQEGCLLDRASAQSLFGSSEPIGSALEYGGRTLAVRGVLETDRPLLLIQVLPETEALSRVTLSLPEGASAQKLLEEFGNRHALSGSWDSRRAWSSFARFFALLAPFALLLSVVLSLLKTAFSMTEFPVPFLVCLLAAGAVWFLLLWLTEVSFRIPGEFIPGKWSDFSFWSRLWEEKKAEFLLLLTSEKTAFDLDALLPALQALAFGLLALLLFPLSLNRVRPRDSRGLWLWCAFFFLLAFLGVLASGGALARDRLLWLCPAAGLCSAFLSRLLARWAAAVKEERPPFPVPGHRFPDRSSPDTFPDGHSPARRTGLPHSGGEAAPKPPKARRYRVP